MAFSHGWKRKHVFFSSFCPVLRHFSDANGSSWVGNAHRTSPALILEELLAPGLSFSGSEWAPSKNFRMDFSHGAKTQKFRMDFSHGVF
jgi:hypothetical protein